MDNPDFPQPNQSSSDSPKKGDAGDEHLQSEHAADLIRKKLDAIYSHEPSAKAEEKEIEAQGHPVSKHQQFMYQISNSGKSVAEIQTAWHEYYQGLSDAEKTEVWEEFYSQQRPQAGNHQLHVHHENHSRAESYEFPVESQVKKTHTPKHRTKRPYNKHSIADYKQQLARKTQVKQKLSAKHHLQSLIFGLGVGAFVVILLLFGFFNERFIAPFITPSRHVNSTPIITDPNSTAVSSNPEIIIPKINVEIPVVYDEPSVAEPAVEKALEKGVVHYATTPYPGQNGNVVIFGHSSNNIFNPGKYKFAFVLLSKLDSGDLFYLDKNGKRYVYQVYQKKIVKPTEVGVLNSADKPDTATLITCDPPGTSINRLIVIGQQISPSPTSNTASTAIKSTGQPATIPSNSQTLWQRFVDWL